MKISLLAIFFFSLAFAQTGRKITGPKTLGQPSYPNSGPLRNRSNDMTGKDMSNATHMGSDVNTSVPSRTLEMKKQEQQEQKEIPTGPYKDGKYQFNKKRE